MYEPTVEIIKEDRIPVAGDRARSEAIITFIIRDFSEKFLEKNRVYTPVFYVRNLKWRLLLVKRFTNELGFFLSCVKQNFVTSPNLVCHAVFMLRLVAPNGMSKDGRVEHNFRSDANGLGHSGFISWTHLMREFVVDDKLTAEVHVVADQPENISIPNILHIPSSEICRKEDNLDSPTMDNQDSFTTETANILPEEIMEKLICGVCQKYLSVKPVKISSDGQIHCGRCSKNDESNTTSLYGLIVENCLFRCINKYDGCRELLNVTNADIHEMGCKSRRVNCPLCIVGTEVPTFRFIKHFMDNHKTSVLEVPYFTIDFENVSVNKTFFLYELSNTLFFVTARNIGDYLQFNIGFVGVPTDKNGISQKFTLSSTNSVTLFETEEKECLAHDSIDDSAFTVPITSKMIDERYVFVKFHLTNVSFAETISITRNHGDEKKDPYSEQYKSVSITEIYSMKPRHIFLSSNITDAYPFLSVHSDSIHLMKKTTDDYIKINLSCFNCSQLEYSVSVDNVDNILFVVDPSSDEQIHQTICNYCYLYVTEKKIELQESDDILSAITAAEIAFFCQWKCGRYFRYFEIDQHEKTCQFQPLRKCPVKYCVHQGILSTFKQHFEKNHSLEYIDLWRSSVMRMHLSVTKSPIKVVVGVSHTFIILVLGWVHPYWRIKIASCDKLYEMKPRVLLFDCRNRFLGRVDTKKVSIIKHIEVLKLKCYLTKNTDVS